MAPRIYHELLTTLKEKIRHVRSEAVLTVNRQILRIYWEIGKTTEKMETTGGWGAKTIDRLSADLKVEFPEMKGFSPRSLRYMREFFKAYPEYKELKPSVAKSYSVKKKNAFTGKSPILQQPAAKLQQFVYQIPWAHHQVILDKVKTTENRLFYIQKTVENGWSRNLLALQIDNQLHERQGKAINNFEHTLSDDRSDLAKETFKNPYLLDFLDVGDEMKENDDFFLDLLFFNYNLNCFIVFELKVGDFKPEFAGKLNFYINAVDNQIRSKTHSRTIGVLLCKTPNNTVVRYALEGVKKPIAVSDYKLSKALPKELKGEMPSIAELEKELEEKTEELKRPTEKRFEKLKHKLSSLNTNKVETAITISLLENVFWQSIQPLFENMLRRMEEFTDYFLQMTHSWYVDNSKMHSLKDMAEHLQKEQQSIPNKKISLLIYLNTFRPAGVDTFNAVVQLNITLNEHWYGFSLTNYNNQQVFKKKLYTQQLLPEEITEICDIACDYLMDQIES